MGIKTIQSVNIRNYRGLAETEISGLGRVNIVVGRNGAGKTSLLEALSLACLGNRPKQFAMIALSRGGLRSLGRSSLESIFTSKVLGVTIDLKTPDGDLYGVVVHPLDLNESFISPEEDNDDAVNPLVTLKMTNQHTTKQGVALPEDESTLEITPTGIRVTKPTNDTSIQAFYLPCRTTSLAPVRRLISKLTTDGQEGRLVEILRVCDERVQDVRLLDDGDIQVELAPKLRLPLSALGDGVNRLALMAEGLLSDDVTVLLLDEIDSGLHQSVMERFWEQILELMEKRPFQLFCTTHNEEMLSATLQPFRKYDKMDWLRKVALTRRQDGNVAVTVSNYDELEYQLDNNYPTRT